jgi:hypothetical protein
VVRGGGVDAGVGRVRWSGSVRLAAFLVTAFPKAGGRAPRALDAPCPARLMGCGGGRPRFPSARRGASTGPSGRAAPAAARFERSALFAAAHRDASCQAGPRRAVPCLPVSSGDSRLVTTLLGLVKWGRASGFSLDGEPGPRSWYTRGFTATARPCPAPILRMLEAAVLVESVVF